MRDSYQSIAVIASDLIFSLSCNIFVFMYLWGQPFVSLLKRMRHVWLIIMNVMCVPWERNTLKPCRLSTYTTAAWMRLCHNEIFFLQFWLTDQNFGMTCELQLIICPISSQTWLGRVTFICFSLELLISTNLTKLG